MVDFSNYDKIMNNRLNQMFYDRLADIQGDNFANMLKYDILKNAKANQAKKMADMYRALHDTKVNVGDAFDRFMANNIKNEASKLAATNKAIKATGQSVAQQMDDVIAKYLYKPNFQLGEASKLSVNPDLAKVRAMQNANMARGGYQQMLANTAPKQISDIPTLVEDALLKGQTTAPKSMVYRNGISTEFIKPSPKIYITPNNAIKLSKALPYLRVAGATAKKILPYAGIPLSEYDIHRSNEIADQMEQINKIQPGSYPQEAIDYYRQKAKIIRGFTGAGMVAGGAGGAFAAGIGAIPGAGLGYGYGGLAGDVTNILKNIDNPYAEIKVKKEDLELLNKYLQGKKAETVKEQDNEVADLTNELMQAKQTTTKPSVVAKNTTPNILRDASGNVMLPNLPSTAPGNNLQGVNTIPVNDSEVSQLATNIGNTVSDSDRLDKLLELYNKRLDLNKPYIEQLQNYVNSYGDYQRQAFNRDRYLAGIAGWSGNDNFAKLMGRYNPAEIEATRLDLMNKLLQTQSGELSGADELIGRATLAEAAGLPIEAALADKDTFKAMSPIMSSINALRGKTYSTDINSRTKLQIAKMNLEGMLQRAKYAGDVRLQVAATNALANVNRALINSMGFSGATASDIGNVYNQLGYTPIDVSELQGNDIDAIINSL